MPDFDVIVVGSGFGGAVLSCRLAAAGQRVLVLERGRRWHPGNFPRAPEDPWLWDDRNPVARHGWFDVRVFPNMSVVLGAGVGGGSLVYANVSVDAKADTFERGFPPEIRFGTLGPHYAEVGRMLGVRPVPAEQIPPRTRLLREAAQKAGYGHRFRQLDLAVRFDEHWRDTLPDAYSAAQSRQHVNEFGAQQGTCVHLGNCDIGCDVNARNTPGPQLPRVGPARRRGDPAAAHRPARPSRLPAATRCTSKRSSEGALRPRRPDRRRGRARCGVARINGDSAPVARARLAAGRQRAARPGLEQQRRLPDPRLSLFPRRAPDEGSDDDRGHRPARRRVPGEGHLRRGRRPAGHRPHVSRAVRQPAARRSARDGHHRVPPPAPRQRRHFPPRDAVVRAGARRGGRHGCGSTASASRSTGTSPRRSRRWTPSPRCTAASRS